MNMAANAEHTQEMRRSTDVAIIGGGVIGCSIAYHLCKLGIHSTVFERDRFASGASGATAGLIAPLRYIDPSATATFELGLRSLEAFPSLADELREAGVDPAFRQSGYLGVALKPEEVDELRSQLVWQAELGIGVRWVDREELLEREPEISQEVLGGVFSPTEAHIRGTSYVDALVHAASRKGATFFQDTEVVGLQTEDGRVTGVRTRQGLMPAGHTVLAAGAWTGIAGRWLPVTLPVSPVKGQRVLLRKTGLLPRCPVNTRHGSVIPEVDGNVLVAATHEEGRFDHDVTAQAVSELVAGAVAIYPALKDATYVGARAGVRPGSPDGLPILGPIPGWEGISIASGHYILGIMLSPGTGELMADSISTGDGVALEPFSIARFGRGPNRDVLV